MVPNEDTLSQFSRQITPILTALCTNQCFYNLVQLSFRDFLFFLFLFLCIFSSGSLYSVFFWIFPITHLPQFFFICVFVYLIRSADFHCFNCHCTLCQMVHMLFLYLCIFGPGSLYSVFFWIFPVTNLPQFSFICVFVYLIHSADFHCSNCRCTLCQVVQSIIFATIRLLFLFLNIFGPD